MTPPCFPWNTEQPGHFWPGYGAVFSTKKSALWSVSPAVMQHPVVAALGFFGHFFCFLIAQCSAGLAQVAVTLLSSPLWVSPSCLAPPWKDTSHRTQAWSTMHGSDGFCQLVFIPPKGCSVLSQIQGEELAPWHRSLLATCTSPFAHP